MTAKTKVELLNGKRGGYIKFCFFGEIKYFKFSQNTRIFKKDEEFFMKNKTISDGGITVDFSIIKVHTSN